MSGRKDFLLQDRDVDSLLSRILSSEGRMNDDRASFLRIFRSIDKNGDGVCSIDELTVGYEGSFEIPPAAIATDTTYPTGLLEEALLHPE
jgi:hypothetical protein